MKFTPEDGNGNRSNPTVPDWIEEKFWSETDPILRRGISIGPEGEADAVKAVLRLRPDLRRQVIDARIRRLRRRLKRKQKRPRRYVRYRWTPFLDEKLRACAAEQGWPDALICMMEATGWPRRVILRRAQRLGIQTGGHRDRPWTQAEIAFLTEAAGNMPYAEIAEQLRRSVASVRWKAAEHGLVKARYGDGFSARQLAKYIGVSRATVEKLIAAKHLWRGRYDLIPEAALVKLVKEHPEDVNWDRLKPEYRVWLLGLIKRNRRKGGGETRKPRSTKMRSSSGPAATDVASGGR